MMNVHLRKLCSRQYMAREQYGSPRRNGKMKYRRAQIASLPVLAVILATIFF
jgi:hypothetical protein